MKAVNARPLTGKNIAAIIANSAETKLRLPAGSIRGTTAIATTKIVGTITTSGGTT